MSSFRELISIGFNKNGDADFRVSMEIRNLSPASVRELRAMVPVAIACAEQNIGQDRHDYGVNEPESATSADPI